MGKKNKNSWLGKENTWEPITSTQEVFLLVQLIELIMFLPSSESRSWVAGLDKQR